MDSEPKENSDLLEVANRKEYNNCGSLERGKSDERPARDPPDGGLRAYLVMIGSFLTNGLLFGLINSYSVIYTELQRQLKEEGVTNSESRASLVGALTMGTTFFLSPLSGVLTGLLGIRLTAVLGGTIATAGLIISSFVVKYVDALCFTYGIMYGLGASLAYTPSLAILGHYFKKHLGLVNGVVTIGSSIFTVIMPPIMHHMIKSYGLDWMYRVMAIFTLGIALCGLLFKPIPLVNLEKPIEKDKRVKTILKTIIDVEIWRNRKYRLWALSMPVALFGYFVPYVHIGNFIKLNFEGQNSYLPIQCLAVTSGVGRLVFGYLADKPGIDRIFLQQISFYVIGMGLFDGAFIALIGPIAIELCDGNCAAQAIGCMLGMAAAPLSIGPPVAGYLFSVYSSYTLPFVLAGISPLVGATLMFTIRLTRPNGKQKHANTTNGHVTTIMSSKESIEKGPVRLLNGDSHEQTSL